MLHKPLGAIHSVRSASNVVCAFKTRVVRRPSATEAFTVIWGVFQFQKHLLVL